MGNLNKQRNLLQFKFLMITPLTTLNFNTSEQRKIMAHQPPKCVKQINNISDFPTCKKAIQSFNSIVLDDKTRWYSEEMTPDYFASQQEYDGYINNIGGRTMDFATIRQKIISKKYSKDNKLYNDMELVFNNAMRHNPSGVVWHDEAQRLYKILKCLKKVKIIDENVTKWVPAPEYDSYNIRSCIQCNNILLPIKLGKPKRCGKCKNNIKAKTSLYICYNHNDKPHEFCRKCVAQYCRSKCFKWHIGKRCKKSKQCKQAKKSSNKNNNLTLPALNLDVPKKPQSVGSVNNFDKIKVNEIIANKFELILKQIKNFDAEKHFWQKAHHPDYPKIVKKPIHFGNILRKIERKKYKKILNIQQDIDLLWRNCYAFNGNPNPNDTTQAFSNWAQTIQWAVEGYMKQLKQILIKRGWIKLSPSSSCLSSPYPTPSPSPSPPPPLQKVKEIS